MTGPVDLAWKDLTFSVPQTKSRTKKKHEESAQVDKVPAKEKLILKKISGMVQAGQMLAVMGSSGAGKTSLLNLLAGRITTSKGAKATGAVHVNGEARDYSKFKKISAYVLQDDDMFAELTVQEQITYAALLRLPSKMSRERKLARVDKVIQELGLAKVRDTQIGNQIIRGISGGERKRVNIGTELVTDPALLFLDEPTTGLDSFNALNVMKSLRHLASTGRTVISTIHQPRSSIFALFDQLLLLSEGRIMYAGPAQQAVAYFSSLNFKSPTQFNPADFFLDLLSVDPRSPEREACTIARIEYLGDKYDAFAPPLSLEDIKRDIEADAERKREQSELVDSDFQSNWVNEFLILTGRAFKLAGRERASNIARLGQTIIFSLILGLIWLNNGRDSDFQSRSSIPGVLFFIVINQAFGGVFSVIFQFPLERSVVTRERAANMYRTSSYFLSKTMTDMPKSLFFNVLFCIIVYWMIGLDSSAGSFFRFILTIFLTTTYAESLALAISIMTGDAQASAALVPVFVILSLLCKFLNCYAGRWIRKMKALSVSLW